MTGNRTELQRPSVAAASVPLACLRACGHPMPPYRRGCSRQLHRTAAITNRLSESAQKASAVALCSWQPVASGTETPMNIVPFCCPQVPLVASCGDPTLSR